MNCGALDVDRVDELEEQYGNLVWRGSALALPRLPVMWQCRGTGRRVQSRMTKRAAWGFHAARRVERCVLYQTTAGRRVVYFRAASMAPAISASPRRPTMVATGWPPLNTMTVGMLMTLNWAASIWALSTLSLPILALPT